MDGWRRAVQDDDEHLVTMCLALNREDPGEQRVSAAQVLRTLTALREQPTRGIAVVLERAGARVGYALLIAFWSNEIGGEICCVDEIYVAPEARGQGHCSALIEALAHAEGLWPGSAVALALEVTPRNARALALYQRLGFTGDNRALRRAVRPR